MGAREEAGCQWGEVTVSWVKTGCQNEWLSRCGQQWIKPDAGRADFSCSSHFSSYGVINFRCKGETRHLENTKGRRKGLHIRWE